MNTLRHTAIHEAGHAVIGRAMAQLCGGVTVIADAEAGEAGHAICADPWATVSAWERAGRWRGYESIMVGRIITMLAGRHAEEVILGSCEGGDAEDMRQVSWMLDDIDRGDDIAFLERAYLMTRMLARRHRVAIEAVAAALESKMTLSAAQIASIIMEAGGNVGRLEAVEP